MKFDFYFFEDNVKRTSIITAAPDIQIKVIIIFIISPLIGETSAAVVGSLGISTVSEDDANIGSTVNSTTSNSINAEKTRFK